MILMILILLGCKNGIGSKPDSDTKTTDKVTPKLSIAEKLGANNHLKIEDRIALYNKLKKEAPNAYNFGNEDEMTMYGYRHLWNGQLTDALEIFKLIVAEFPDSSNPYDSLGEAYLKNGQKDLARQQFEQVLVLEPEHEHAQKMLAELAGS